MFKNFFAFLMIPVIVFSIGGVAAGWIYPEGPNSPEFQEFGMSASLFEYKPEEILPGGDSEKPEIGQNHLALIDLILNERDKGYGLNINNNVVLHRYLRNDGVVYSNQKVTGGNLKFILDPSNNTHGLYYCVEYVSSTLYYAYTFSTVALNDAGGTEAEIAVYRTILEKTDKWNATLSYYGYAKVEELSDLGASADPKSIPYSIDVSTWRLAE